VSTHVDSSTLPVRLAEQRHRGDEVSSTSIKVANITEATISQGL
jgi:hypothetical protein